MADQASEDAPRGAGATRPAEPSTERSAGKSMGKSTGKSTGKPTGRWRREPILPEAGAAGAPLTATLAVMSFLAVIAMAAALIINDAAARWTSALRSEVTVQIKGADADAIDASADAALALLRATPGVIEATRRDREETAALLEPWLGRGNADAFLTIPALIEVKISPEGRAGLSALETRLAETAPGAVIDDHGAWRDRLDAAARSGALLAIGVFALVTLAACAIAAFAARAGLAANRDIVSVLHLIGATDGFIAEQVQRRFFILGARGAAAGLAVAFLVLAAMSSALEAGLAANAFLPRFAIDGWRWLWLLAAPIVICLVTGLTARLTVMRALASQY